MFVLCLADLPYGYYQFVRFAALIGFAILAVDSNSRGDRVLVLIYVGLALLFQPFIKLALGRHIWNIVDVVIALALILSLFDTRKNK